MTTSIVFGASLPSPQPPVRDLGEQQGRPHYEQCIDGRHNAAKASLRATPFLVAALAAADERADVDDRSLSPGRRFGLGRPSRQRSARRDRRDPVRRWRHDIQLAACYDSAQPSEPAPNPR
jgi:hypothetical protein